MRLEQVAAVDDGRDGADELDRRDAERLAEGGGDQRRRGRAGQIRLGEEEALRLAGQVDAGLFEEAEGVDVIIELLAADAQANVAEGDVAGIAERLFERFGSSGHGP